MIQNGIIYVIPTDELYEKWGNGEAFIDEYGRLMDRKSHRVVRMLRHSADRRPIVVEAPPQESSTGKGIVVDFLADTIQAVIYRFKDWAIDDGIPRAFEFYREKRDMICEAHKEYKKNGNKLKCKMILEKSQSDSDAAAVIKAKPIIKMTQAEADFEKRKVLYHWLEMLNSLRRLREAGEIDMGATLAQLTDPEMLARVNGFLSENPNLLETDKYISLRGLLGRDLYEGKQLIPIRAREIDTIAMEYGYEAKGNITEDNRNG